MKRLPVILFLLLVVLVFAGGAFLATWDIPPPLARVEKTLPDDRFPR